MVPVVNLEEKDCQTANLLFLDDIYFDNVCPQGGGGDENCDVPKINTKYAPDPDIYIYIYRRRLARSHH